MKQVQIIPILSPKTLEAALAIESPAQSVNLVKSRVHATAGRIDRPPLNLVFEPFSFCPLHCCSCPTGRRNLKLDSAVLKVSELESMLQTVSLQAKINRIGLFNWGEPTLCTHLPDLVRTAKPYGRTYISTTGNH